VLREKEKIANFPMKETIADSENVFNTKPK
jgi:hypothetical protein